ncbi:MAG: 6-chlorohydroxyquinol-1,2-dioxygenase, partial [Gammaproteobacteria bacterium]|nr:6-chlorohydroxyquinol-1,2-dioxygenase [Gammaproteobacteria bacterium]
VSAMRSVNKDNITETFLGYFGPDTDPRLAFVMERLAHHLHTFAKDVNLTHEEWRKAIDFLNAAGKISTPERDEFILLSDVLGLSSLIDMLHSSARGTSSSVLGPFHIAGAPPMPVGGDMRKDNEGELVVFRGRVLDPDGEPIGGAELDIWQTAANGMYSSQDENQDTYNFHALMTTGEDGAYALTTVKPVSYTVPTDGPVGDILRATGRHPWRPSHLHIIVKARGFNTLVTEIFPDDDPYLDEDTVFGVRGDLVMHYARQPAEAFPEGLELSGQVDEDFQLVEFDLHLVPDTSIASG